MKGQLWAVICIFATSFGFAVGVLLHAIDPTARWLPYLAGAGAAVLFLFGTLFVMDSQQVDISRVDESLDRFPLAFGLLDSERRIRWLNPAAQKLLGLDGASLVGRSWPDLLDGLCVDAAVAFHPDEGICRETRRSDGGTFPLEYLVAPFETPTENAKNYHYLLLLRDAGRLMKDLREESETERIRTAACMAKQIAHEVLNPVAAISGSAQVLGHLSNKARKGDPRILEILDHEREVLCQSIIEESARLDGIVSRFLSFTTLSEENIRQAMQFDPAKESNLSEEKTTAAILS